MAHTRIWRGRGRNRGGKWKGSLASYASRTRGNLHNRRAYYGGLFECMEYLPHGKYIFAFRGCSGSQGLRAYACFILLRFVEFECIIRCGKNRKMPCIISIFHIKLMFLFSLKKYFQAIHC